MGGDPLVTFFEWVFGVLLFGGVPLCLLLRAVNSGGTMRRKDVERNTAQFLRAAQQRKAAQDARRALDQILKDNPRKGR